MTDVDVVFFLFIKKFQTNSIHGEEQHRALLRDEPLPAGVGEEGDAVALLPCLYERTFAEDRRQHSDA